MRVLVVQPRYNNTVLQPAAVAFYNPLLPDRPCPPPEGAISEIRLSSMGSSALTCTFNDHWCQALNSFEAGEIDAFAMIHADVGAQIGWLDILHSELKRSGADLISAVIPIKDGRGLSSTGVDDTGNRWRVRRLAMKEVSELPLTFTDEDVGGELLLNTGCWLLKMDRRLLNGLPPFFDIHNRVIRNEAGKWESDFIPEDWDFSRQMRRRGIKLAATRLVTIDHHGEAKWSNQKVWGQDYDVQNAPQRNGSARLHNPAACAV